MFNFQEILVLDKAMIQKLINILTKVFGVNSKKNREKKATSDDIYLMW